MKNMSPNFPKPMFKNVNRMNLKIPLVFYFVFSLCLAYQFKDGMEPTYPSFILSLF